MKKIILTVLLLPAFAFSESILVKLDSELDSHQLRSLASSLRSDVDSIKKIPLVDNWYEIETNEVQDSDLLDLKRSSNVLEVQRSQMYSPQILESQGPVKISRVTAEALQRNNVPFQVYPLQTGKDPKCTNNWNISFNSIYKVWDYAEGEGVTIAVIDTGVDYTHADLNQNIAINKGEWGANGELANNGIDDDGNGFIDDHVGWDFLENDNLPYDTHSHGTHVAGIAAAPRGNGVGVCGVAPKAKILPIRFIGDKGGSDADAVRSLNYAKIMGVDIMNNSWGGTDDNPLLREAFEKLEDSGILVISAAGNEGLDISMVQEYPGRYKYKNTLVISANRSENLMTWWTNHSKKYVQMSAAGYEITSTVPGDSYTSYSGTSMATPQVAGAAALALGLRPDLTPEQVKKLFKEKDPYQRTVHVHDPYNGFYTKYTEWRKYSSPRFSIKYLFEHPNWK